MLGLAGALRVDDMPALQALEPDILGFRSALCDGFVRGDELSGAKVCAVRRAIAESGAKVSSPFFADHVHAVDSADRG